MPPTEQILAENVLLRAENAMLVRHLTDAAHRIKSAIHAGELALDYAREIHRTVEAVLVVMKLKQEE